MDKRLRSYCEYSCETSSNRSAMGPGPIQMAAEPARIAKAVESIRTVLTCRPATDIRKKITRMEAEAARMPIRDREKRRALNNRTAINTYNISFESPDGETIKYRKLVADSLC